jgi:hypothetical protein
MKTTIVFAFLFLGKISEGQESGKKYFFEEMGWSVTLPADFVPTAPDKEVEIHKQGEKMIERSNNVVLDKRTYKTLVSAFKGKNYFNSTIQSFNPAQYGNYDSVKSVAKKLVYKTFISKVPSAKIDSLSSIQLIDSISFDKFQMKITIGENSVMYMLLLSKLYRGYDFTITYLYLDDKTKEQIEMMLATSKFEKKK